MNDFHLIFNATKLALFSDGIKPMPSNFLRAQWPRDPQSEKKFISTNHSGFPDKPKNGIELKNDRNGKKAEIRLNLQKWIDFLKIRDFLSFVSLPFDSSSSKSFEIKFLRSIDIFDRSKHLRENLKLVFTKRKWKKEDLVCDILSLSQTYKHTHPYAHPHIHT